MPTAEAAITYVICRHMANVEASGITIDNILKELETIVLKAKKQAAAPAISPRFTTRLQRA